MFSLKILQFLTNKSCTTMLSKVALFGLLGFICSQTITLRVTKLVGHIPPPLLRFNLCQMLYIMTTCKPLHWGSNCNANMLCEVAILKVVANANTGSKTQITLFPIFAFKMFICYSNSPDTRRIEGIFWKILFAQMSSKFDNIK